MVNNSKMMTGIFLLMLTAFLLCSCPNVYSSDFNEEWLGEKPDWAPDVSVSTAFMTKYIWRGQNLGDEPVMQYDASLSKWGITLDLWGNYTFNNDKAVDGGRYQEITEQDYTIDYTFSLGEMISKFGYSDTEIFDPLSISGGYIYYTFPNGDWDSELFDSHEIYMGIAYDTWLQPSFTWYWDVDDGSGSYLLMGIGHSFDFEAGIFASIGMTAGYNHEQWTTESGWSDMVFSGEVSIPVLTYFTITPSVAYSVILDDDTYLGAQENEFYGGVTIGFAY